MKTPMYSRLRLCAEPLLKLYGINEEKKNQRTFMLLLHVSLENVCTVNLVKISSYCSVGITIFF